jgi:ribose/xylose/arabinose/galactoside ABC-type transport system permease subunit
MVKNTQKSSRPASSVLFKNLFSVVILAIIFIFFIIQAPGFLSYNSLVNIFRSSVVLIVVALGATVLLVSGNVDLSVGSVIALTCVTFALLARAGVPVVLGILAAAVIGAVVGFINSVLVVNLRINSVIATLGSLYFIRGIAYIIMGDEPSIIPKVASFSFLGRGFLGPVPFQVIVIVFFVALFYMLEKKSLLWKYSVAIGCNRVAATLSGINIRKIIGGLYILVGALAGFSGAILASKLSVGQKFVGEGFEFDVIIAILLGGTSFRGGEGTTIGTVVGALVVSILGIGLNMMGIASFYQYVIKGIILILVVFSDKLLKDKVLSRIVART